MTLTKSFLTQRTNNFLGSYEGGQFEAFSGGQFLPFFWGRFFRFFHSADQHTQLDRIITLIADTYNHIRPTIDQLRSLSGLPDNLPDLPPAKPHFNRYAFQASEPQHLHTLLIRHQLIPPTTPPQTTAYIFYGIGTSASWQPILWLHTVAELSYFIDMFFGISDQRDKWRTAHLCFCNKKHRPFNYNSLRGKQYNYLSNRNSETLRTIDQIRNCLK